jgi:hypothetical protein
MSQQVILPLQNVRGSYIRIHAALSRLRQLAEQVNSSLVFERFDSAARDCLNGIQLGLQAATEMFRRQVTAPLQVNFSIIEQYGVGA